MGTAASLIGAQTELLGSFFLFKFCIPLALTAKAGRVTDVFTFSHRETSPSGQPRQNSAPSVQIIKPLAPCHAMLCIVSMLRQGIYGQRTAKVMKMRISAHTRASQVCMSGQGIRADTECLGLFS